MPPKKKKSASKKPSPKKTAVRKTARKKAAKKKAAPVKKRAAAKKKAPAKKKAAAKKSATRKKQAARTLKAKAPKKKASAASKKSRSKNSNTPAIFKVRTKKQGPSNFTLDDVHALLKEKKNKSGSGSASAKKAAPQKKSSGDVDPGVDMEKRKLGAASINDILGINAAPTSTKSGSTDDESKVPKKWLKYYRDLIELRDHFTDELQLHTSETLKRSSREDSGDLSGYGQHQADAGTDTFDRDLALSMVSTEQDALHEIEQAIKRIFNGTYGICEITEKPISKARLKAVPFTRFSVEGQAQWERMNRRKVERGGVFADTEDSPTLTTSDDDD